MEAWEGYEIRQLQSGLWQIEDDRGCTLYLVEGKEKAMLIDTGVRPGTIRPMIESLTDKPVELVLTHAHIDHMYHAEEFETVYAHKMDCRGLALAFLLWYGHIHYHIPDKKYHRKRFYRLEEGDALDLGGVSLKVLLAAGHTPGSVFLVDEQHQVIFCGDAIGSGGGMWLWLPGCFTVSAYQKSLQELIKKLEPYRNYTFLGGHRKQGEAATGDGHRGPLTIQVAEDMEELCGKILDHSIQPEAIHKVNHTTVERFFWKRAGMDVSKNRIK